MARQGRTGSAEWIIEVGGGYRVLPAQIREAGSETLVEFTLHISYEGFVLEETMNEDFK